MVLIRSFQGGPNTLSIFEILKGGRGKLAKKKNRNRFVRTCLQGLIPCLKFTIEIESNNLMYNRNEEIRNKEFPIKIGKFSVKYYTFKKLQG